MAGLPGFRHERYWKRPWVARIVGADPVFGLAREFVDGLTDHTNARGNTGITKSFFLEDGYHEVNEIVSAKYDRRYFIRVADGAFGEVPKQEVEAWIAASEKSG